MFSKKPNDAKTQLVDFVSRDPKSRYTFDSERDAPQSQICRETGKLSRECITLEMNSKQLFEAMQVSFALFRSILPKPIWNVLHYQAHSFKGAAFSEDIIRRCSKLIQNISDKRRHSLHSSDLIFDAQHPNFRFFQMRATYLAPALGGSKVN
ncbi:hypothetical protein C8J56DRAFT_224275 [Mycena floridula]|nr:hypothetical protein C8J56DRAFT_224275 [Mycena floridula]